MSENRNRKPGSVVWPLVLISLGLVFLLNNLEIISWDVWFTIGRMWPVLLVAIGIDLIFGRRSGIGAAISAVLILAIFAGAFWLLGVTGDVWSGDQLTELIVQELGKAKEAEVEISMNVGVLEIYAMPESSDLLVEGQIQVSEFERISENYRLEDETVVYSLTTKGQQYHPGWLFSNRVDQTKGWELFLNRNVALDLNVDTGVGKTVVNLTGINLTYLDVDIGVGEVVVILPEEGSYQVRVNGGVGKLEIQIPTGVAARINLDTGLGSTTVLGDYDYQNGAYYSESYSSSDEQVEIFIDGGVGNIRLLEINN